MALFLLSQAVFMDVGMAVVLGTARRVLGAEPTYMYHLNNWAGWAAFAVLTFVVGLVPALYRVARWRWSGQILLTAASVEVRSSGQWSGLPAVPWRDTSAFASAGTGLRWTQPFWLTARAQCPASDGGEPTELVIPLSVRGMSPTEVIELLNRYRLTALGAAER
ncbi:MAG: hypothetical protein U0Q19_00750 [Kineosporiaceae bacterium]